MKITWKIGGSSRMLAVFWCDLCNYESSLSFTNSGLWNPMEFKASMLAKLIQCSRGFYFPNVFYISSSFLLVQVLQVMLSSFQVINRTLKDNQKQIAKGKNVNPQDPKLGPSHPNSDQPCSIFNKAHISTDQWKQVGKLIKGLCAGHVSVFPICLYLLYWVSKFVLDLESHTYRDLVRMCQLWALKWVE